MAKQISIGVVAAALSGDGREAAARANRMGFSGLQFDAVMAGLDLTTLSLTGRREFRRVLEQQNQSLIGLRADAGAKGLLLGADVDRVLWRWDQILETAAGLQSPLVCVDLGPLPAPVAVVEAKPVVTQDQAGIIFLPAATKPIAPPAPAMAFDAALAAQVDAVLVELGRRADRYGVVLALRSDLASLAALQRALLAANCPWFGVDLDPVAILRDEWALEETISRMGHLIRHVRGRDALAGADRRTRPTTIGKGATDWRNLLEMLDEAGFNGWISVDPIELADRPAGAAAGLEELRGLLNKAGSIH